MKDNKEMKVQIQRDIGTLAEILEQLSAAYEDEPLLKDAREAFLSLSVHVGKALDLPLQ